MLIYLINNNNVISVAIAIALFNYKSGIMTTVMAIIADLMELSKEFNDQGTHNELLYRNVYTRNCIKQKF